MQPPLRGGFYFFKFKKFITLKKIFTWFIAAICLFLLFRAIDLSALTKLFFTLSLPVLLILIFISLILVLISAIKWQKFIQFLGKKVSLQKLFGLYLEGYYFNLIVPSYLGGDAVRSFQIGKEVGQHNAAASTILERYTGLFAMLSLGLVCTFLTKIVTFEIKLILMGLFLGLSLITLLGLSRSFQEKFNWMPGYSIISSHISKITDSFHLVVGHRVLLLETLLLSYCYHAVAIINTLACGYAVGWQNIPITGLFVVLPIILVVSALPIAPQGLGIQEGAFFYFLTKLGATPEQALGISILLRAKSYCLALVGGALYHLSFADSSDK